MSHTPAPWYIAGYAGEHEEAGAKIMSHGSAANRIASTASISWHAPAEEWQEYYANARLIEKAPELLAALELVMSKHMRSKKGGILDATQFIPTRP